MTAWAQLAACLVGMALLWGWLLPAIGQRAAVRESIELMNRRGINPGAIFYTDVFQSTESACATEFINEG